MVSLRGEGGGVMGGSILLVFYCMVMLLKIIN